MSIYSGKKYTVLQMTWSGEPGLPHNTTIVGTFSTELEALNYISSLYSGSPWSGGPYALALAWFSVVESNFVSNSTPGYPRYPGYDDTTPSGVQNVNLSSADGVNYLLTWEPPIDDGGLPVISYTVTLAGTVGNNNTQGSPTSSASSIILPSSQLSVTFPGATPESLCAYFSGAGSYLESSSIDGLAYTAYWSPIISANSALGEGINVTSNVLVLYAGLPDCPTNCTASTSGSDYVLSWDQAYPTAAGTPTSWVILLNGNAASPVATVACTEDATSGTFTIAASGNPLSAYSVASVNSGGQSCNVAFTAA
jgi:hypothetical protein